MALAIVVKVKGLENLPAKLERFRMGVIARVARMLQLIGQEVAGQSKEKYLTGRPGLNRVSGDLARSVTYVVKGNRVVIGSNLRYARIHELGGVIRAKTAPLLTFKIGGKWISKLQVTIPARPFLTPALNDSKGPAKTIVHRLVDEALREAMA